MADAQKISTEQLLKLLAARRVNVSGRWLRRLAKEKGLFPEPVLEQYEFLPTLLGLIEHYHLLYTRGSGAVEAEEQRIIVGKRRIVEVAADRAENEVEETAEVERSRIALVVMIRQKLLAFPSKASSYLACCTDQKQMESELEKQIHQILTDLEQPAFIARPDPRPEDGPAE